MKVCHVTNKHEPKDIRIFHKECVSLAEAGHDVWLVEKGESEEIMGVHIIGCGEAPKSRRKRMTFFARKAYRIAADLDCEVYHIHDPELLPYAMKFKKQGKKVIFDSHEDVPAQILDKHWIPKPVRSVVARTYRTYETHVVARIDAVVAATPHIAEQFKGRANKVAVVNNYPKLDDITFHDTPFEERDAIVCYAGGINELRGEKVMIEAMKDVRGTLVIAGDHEVMELGGGSIRFIGTLDRSEVNELYGRAVVGLCMLKPIENYLHSKPIKVYEYMAAGLPYICSNFPGWIEVAERSGAGIYIEPDDPEALAEAISGLLENRETAQAMGLKGFEYVKRGCSWEVEAKALTALYEEVEGTG